MKLRKFISMGGRASSSVLRSRIALRLPSCVLASAVALCAALTLTGCSGSFDPKLSGAEPATGASGITFKGHIQGGQAPIYDANIYVFQTGESGYPGAGVPANVSFITSTAPGTFNGAVNGNNYGPHVNTDSNGNFSFTLNNCTPGAGVYIVSYGGQPIFGTQNVSAGEMASMGVCPANSTTGLFANNPFVNVTEVSTVAFAYAVGGFTAAGYDFSHISTSATNIAAMNNAFNLAQQLFSISTTGGANTSSASMPGATFPAAKINTMANILADCINSGGVTSSSAPCYTLFQNATSNGVTGSGTVPSDTASAMINITHNVQSNVSNIYALASNSYSPFSPTLSAAPDSFAMPVIYSTSGMYDPYQIAIDSTGAVYALSQHSSTGAVSPSITKITPGSGVIGSTALSKYSSIAIDHSNNIFLVNQDTTAPVVTEYASSASSPLGTQIATLPSFGSAAINNNSFTQPVILVGPSNDVELDVIGSNIYRSTYSGSAYTTPTSIIGVLGGTSSGLVENGGGTSWFTGGTSLFTSNNSTLNSGYDLLGQSLSYLALTAKGVPFVVYSGGMWLSNSANSGTQGFTSSNILSPTYPSVDGFSNAWMTGVGSGFCRVEAFSPTANSSATLPSFYSNFGFYVDGTAAGSCLSNSAATSGMSIDQGGNLWVPVRSGSSAGYMVEELGVAAPTIEPLSVQIETALPTNTTFSNLP